MNAEGRSSTNHGLILVITAEVPEAYAMIWTVHAWPLRGVPKIGIANWWSEHFAVGASVLPVGFPKREMSIFAFVPTAVYRGLPWDICPIIIYRTKMTLFATESIVRAARSLDKIPAYATTNLLYEVSNKPACSALYTLRLVRKSLFPYKPFDGGEP